MSGFRGSSPGVGAHIHLRQPPAKRPKIDGLSPLTEQIAGPRPSQRAPKSCLECARRKIKCDKELPCGPCTERGAATECRREAVYVKGAITGGDLAQRATTLDTLAREVEELRKRVTQLEKGRVSPPSHETDGSDPSMSKQPISDVDQSQLPGTMEEIALGIGESTRWKGASLLNSKEGDTIGATQWYQSITFETSLSALPSRPNSHILVDYYIEQVSWMACAIHGPSFVSEHDSFWHRLERSELRDGLWLGLLFAVLSVSAFFMEEDQAAQRGFSYQYLKIVGTAWFDSALAILYRCGLWTRPSLLTCQILQVLSPAFHLSGNTSLHQNLYGVLISQMRAINLHLLGSRKDDTANETISKEMGRRIWWNGVEIDWIFLPYHRYIREGLSLEEANDADFSPRQFTTAMPELTDESCPISDGSMTVQYRTACYNSARCIYDAYGHLGISEDPSHDRVLAASKQLDAITAELPVQLRFDRSTPTSYGLFTVETTRQRLLALTLAYRSYQLHRPFFVRSLTDSRYIASREACLTAADAITAVIDCGLPRVFLQLWNVTVSLVAAGIILSIQSLESARAGTSLTSSSTHRPRIRSLIDRLRSSNDQSGIASRGATFISYLLQVEEEISAGRRTEVKFTRDSMLALVQAGLHLAQNHTSSVAESTPTGVGSLGSASAQGLDLSVTGFADVYGMAYTHQGEFDFAALLNDFVADP